MVSRLFDFKKNLSFILSTVIGKKSYLLTAFCAPRTMLDSLTHFKIFNYSLVCFLEKIPIFILFLKSIYLFNVRMDKVK